MDNVTQSHSHMTSIENGDLETVQGNVKAIMASGRIWTSGCQAISHTIAAAAQAQLERNFSTWKAMTGAKSIKEAWELNVDLTRTSVEKIVAATGKLAEASMKLAEQTLVPMTARMTLAAEKFSSPTIRE